MRRAFLAALALAACARIPFTEPQPTPTAEQGAWGEARVRYTRAGKVYDGLGMNAFVSAVYEPVEAREAREERLAVWRSSTGAERDAALAREREDAARCEQFLVAVFTPDPSDNDLDRKTSIWHVALVLPGGAEVVPDTIETRHVDATVRALYPNVGDFDHVYQIRFPKQPEALAGRPFLLRLAGSRGKLDLDFAPQPQAQAR